MPYVQFPEGNVIHTQNPEYHKEAKRLTNREGEALYRAQIRAEVLAWLKPGATVYCVLRSVSSSGMSRRISFYALDQNADDRKPLRAAELRYLDHAIASLTSYKQSSKEGLSVGGCGMDMGFAVVYDFGRALWPNGTPEPHGTRNGVPDSNGGYALKSTWL